MMISPKVVAPPSKSAANPLSAITAKTSPGGKAAPQQILNVRPGFPSPGFQSPPVPGKPGMQIAPPRTIGPPKGNVQGVFAAAQQAGPGKSGGLATFVGQSGPKSNFVGGKGGATAPKLANMTALNPQIVRPPSVPAGPRATGPMGLSSPQVVLPPGLDSPLLNQTAPGGNASATVAGLATALAGLQSNLPAGLASGLAALPGLANVLTGKGSAGGGFGDTAAEDDGGKGRGKGMKGQDNSGWGNEGSSWDDYKSWDNRRDDDKGRKGKGKRNRDGDGKGEGKDGGKKGGKRRDKREKLPDGPTVFVGNLSYDATSEALQEYFSASGDVVAARVMISGKGKSKGAGLVVYSSEKEKLRAIEHLHQVEFEGRSLTVREWTTIKKEDILDFSALMGEGDMSLLDEDDEDEDEDEDEEGGDGQWNENKWGDEEGAKGGGGGEANAEGGAQSAEMDAASAPPASSSWAPGAEAAPMDTMGGQMPPPLQTPMQGGCGPADMPVPAPPAPDMGGMPSFEGMPPMPPPMGSMPLMTDGQMGAMPPTMDGQQTAPPPASAPPSTAPDGAPPPPPPPGPPGAPPPESQVPNRGDLLPSDKVKVMDPDGKFIEPRAFKSFDECPWPKALMEEVDKAGFTVPSPVQMYTWPISVQALDLVGVAQTGSGKTLGYLFPVFAHILENFVKAEDPIILTMAPTRELACQIENESNKFGYDAGIRTVCAYGGAPKGPQIGALRRGCHHLVATPGRLNDFIEGGDVLKLDGIAKLVIDEADRMLDMGFEPQIRKALKQIPTKRHTLFFTATWPANVQKLAMEFLNRPYQVEIGNPDVLKASENVTQLVKIVDPDRKVRELIKVFLQFDISEKGKGDNRALIFCSTKKMCEQLEDGLNRARVNCQSIHGDKDQKEREKALNDLRDGITKILCATDVAARGLDIKGVTLVVNYDPPNHAEDYVHRIGRTGRAGKKGTSVSFLTARDQFKGRDILTVMERNKQDIPKELRQLVDGTLKEKKRARSRSRSRGRDGGRYGRSRERDNRDRRDRDYRGSDRDYRGSDRDYRDRYRDDRRDRDRDGDRYRDRDRDDRYRDRDGDRYRDRDRRSRERERERDRERRSRDRRSRSRRDRRSRSRRSGSRGRKEERKQRTTYFSDKPDESTEAPKEEPESPKPETARDDGPWRPPDGPPAGFSEGPPPGFSEGPPDGFAPPGPPDGFMPSGPPDGFQPVGPPDGFQPVGPPDGFQPVGAGYSSQAPPPGFPPEGPPGFSGPPGGFSGPPGGFSSEGPPPWQGQEPQDQWIPQGEQPPLWGNPPPASAPPPMQDWQPQPPAPGQLPPQWDLQPPPMPQWVELQPPAPPQWGQQPLAPPAPQWTPPDQWSAPPPEQQWGDHLQPPPW